MIEFLKNLATKSFWPLIGCYGLYFLYQIYIYYYGLKYVVDKQIYNHWIMGKIIIAGTIVGISILFKLWGKVRIASLVLAVPAVITVGTVLIVLAVWLFLAVVFILFGKS